MPWQFGRLVLLCLAIGPACKFCLGVRKMFYDYLGVNPTFAKNTRLRTRSPSLYPVWPMDGLSAGELAALASEGELSPKGGLQMGDLMQKVLFGGFVKGSRTQWLGYATLLGTISNAVVQYMVGDIGLVGMMDVLKGNWEGLVLGWGLVTLGDKVDGAKK